MEGPYALIGVPKQKWTDLILAGSKRFNISLSEKQIALMATHAAELVIWNRRMNLTAIRSPREMAIKHYVDSLAAAPYLNPNERVLDLGSGAGFPGIPLKIANPDIHLTLIDANRRKCSFLSHVCRHMGLDDIRVEHGHLPKSDGDGIDPDNGDRDRAGPVYDVIISRAVGPLSDLLAISRSLLKPAGRLMALKGPEGDASHSSLPNRGNGRWQVRRHDYRLLLGYGQRQLFIVEAL